MFKVPSSKTGSRVGTWNLEPETLEFYRLRLLRFVTMVGVRVNLYFLCHCLSELCLRKHPLDGEFDHPFRMLFKHVLSAYFAKTARIKGVSAIKLLVVLRTLKDRVPCVDHNAVIAHVQKGRPRRIVLAGNDAGDLGRKPADRLAPGIDDEPFAAIRQPFSARKISTHNCTHLECFPPKKRTDRVSKCRVKVKLGAADEQAKGN